MIRIAVIVGSTRPGRRGGLVAQWVHETAGRHEAVRTGRASVEIVDIADYGLPLLDEPLPAKWGRYEHTYTRRWAEAIAGYDGFVFVTPEYNHSIPGALKNAIDHLCAEWENKAAGTVSYGIQGGQHAAEHLRTILGELKVADVRSHVALGMFTDFQITDPVEPGLCSPAEHQEETLATLLDELVAWAEALRPLREHRPVAA